MSIVTKQLTLTGAAGSASASASTHALMQRLVPVEVLRDGQPNTLNVTVANSARTLLTLTGITADRLVAPKLPVQSATGSDLPDEVDSPWVNGALTITATGGNAGTPAFTYVYPGGPKRQRCDDHTHPNKLGIRQRREAQRAAEDQLPESSAPTGEPEPERACRECGTPTAAWTKGRPFCAKCRWLSVTCQNCGIDFDAARPRVAAQSPRTTCKSCSIRASRKKRAEDEAALAQLNARLGEEDARRVVRLVERVRQDVRVIRRDGDYDVLLVDGTPIKVRRAVGA